MTQNYKIKVHIEIIESDQETQGEPVEAGSGQFELVLNESQALSIDECENALLRANYPAVRAALAEIDAAKRSGAHCRSRSSAPEAI